MVDSTLIQRCIHAILAACPAGTRVVLFGSRARGDDRPNSDVDLLVIEPQVSARLLEAARLARVIRSLRVPTDIVVVSHDTLEQWKDTPNSFYFEAAHGGQVFV